MKRKLWKQIGLGVFGGMIVAAAFAYIPTKAEPSVSPQINKRLEKRQVLIRLEDVGLGGDYNTLEGLGKLRAVIDYLASEDVPFHVAVIPRRMSLKADGVWQERGIDDPNPDPVVSAFISLLQGAERQGGLLGMHGYRHQYGESYREDGEQNSGIGAEFNVDGAPETKETSYAVERLKDSLAAFAKADLHPVFWESPHYQDTREQQAIFRSYMGMLFQPDIYVKGSTKDVNYHDTVNTFGQDSLGSVYIPAPFRYVSDASSVEQILSKAKSDDALASFYFHPFLEFAKLEPELDAEGKAIMKDQLPLYRYKKGEDASYLHKLVQGFKAQGYRWSSLYDIVPFSPAHRVSLPLGTKLRNVMLGDVTGQGHADVIVRQAHRVLVIPGTYTWPRNRPQEASQVWLKEAFAPEEQTLLIDLNGDRKEDLLAYNELTGDMRVAWADKGHFRTPESVGIVPAGLHGLKPFQSEEGRGLIAKGEKGIVEISYLHQQLEYAEVTSELDDDTDLYPGRFEGPDADDILCYSRKARKISILYHGRGGRFAPPQAVDSVKTGRGDQLLVGDANGDGRSDLITYTAETGIWHVFENKGEHRFQPLDNAFGPWATGAKREAVVADFDGNQKADVASYNEAEHVLDLALSFRGAVTQR
ncbi:DUF2334 domain-containing protein [Paenibacillus roseipurpureus]|uniref:DUF2334 domain-containing protein n=1 Tax=Paenibacillus roseopurpureus TaxID=2918901 RepID=A0AA96RJ04_9BACL|nr:DUF2334 domain-containing protein [Paenibacillus sp. MBLB1832]WNR44868.1 DUF2334 domain-containing protein [Paenibacillus sp. MBLB1832]